MTNPFATFRKNQKYWMAGLVLLAILSFVIYPVFDYASQAIRGGGMDNTVVVRWNGGKITGAELQNTIRKHSTLVRFLDKLSQEVIEAGGQPNVPGFGYDPQSGRILGLGIQTNSDPQSVCRTRIMAAHAQRQGIEFTDEAIDNFLREFCDGKVSGMRIEEILGEATDGRLSWFEIREMLKKELSAVVLGQIARTGLEAYTPGKTYADFVKLNRTAKVEAFPVFVDDFLDKVTLDPSEGEVLALYESGMRVPANPNSLEPGFLRTYQANVAYVEADLQAWVDREKEKLSEDTLRAEYDRRIELDQLRVPVTSDAADSAEEGSPQDNPQEANAEPDVDGDAEQTEADDGGPTEAGSRESGETSQPVSPDLGTEREEDETASDVDPSTEADSDAAPSRPGADGEQTDAAADADPSDDSATLRGPTPHFVAFQQSEEDNSGTGDESASDEQAAESDPESASDEEEVRDAASAEADDEPVEEPAESGADAVDMTADGSDAGPESAPNDEGQPETRPQTFEEARDIVADSLARDAAATGVQVALREMLEDVMRPYYQAYRRHQAFLDSGLTVDEDGQQRQAPLLPDLKAEAEKRGLTFVETGLTDRARLAATPFGQSNVNAGDPSMGGTVANLMMAQNVETYFPMESSYFDQAALMQGGSPRFVRYLFWKTEERLPYIPELDEVRAEVVDVWKRQRASQLAGNAARELTEKMGGDLEDPWGDALTTAEKALIVETDPFTWISRFGEFNMPSNVPKLDRVGGEFMQAVFATPAGQIGLAPNAGSSIYYVFRVLEFSPAPEELQQRFSADPIKSGPMGIAREESNRLLLDWYQNLESEMGVQWQMDLSQLY